MAEIEFDIGFDADPFGDDAFHSTNCLVGDAMIDAEREVIGWEREAKRAKKNGKGS